MVLRTECSSCLCKLLTREYCTRRRFLLAPDVEEPLPRSRSESFLWLWCFLLWGWHLSPHTRAVFLPAFPTKQQSRSTIVLQVGGNPYQAGLDNKDNVLTHVTERSDCGFGLRSGSIRGSRDVNCSSPLSFPLLCFHDVGPIRRWFQWEEDFSLPQARPTLPD